MARPIRFAALIYPTVDLTLTGGSIVENGKGYFLEKADMDWFMSHYLNSEDDRSGRAGITGAPRQPLGAAAVLHHDHGILLVF